MGATEVKAKMLALLDEVATDAQIEITNHERVAASLVPGRGPDALRVQFSGVAWSEAEEDELFNRRSLGHPLTTVSRDTRGLHWWSAERERPRGAAE